jgi:hypothetical protein
MAALFVIPINSSTPNAFVALLPCSCLFSPMPLVPTPPEPFPISHQAKLPERVNPYFIHLELLATFVGGTKPVEALAAGGPSDDHIQQQAGAR